ncbi:MAG: hypothetical protein GY914_07660, partial [Prochlorococcus sp.]|nr:hypothetical protein [Prochlorococcus sp.]
MSLRRMGHILENNPGNIASVLRGRAPDSTVRAFVATDSGTGGHPSGSDPWHTGADPWGQTASQSTWAAGTWSTPAAPAPHYAPAPSSEPWYHESYYIGDDDDEGTDSDTVSSDGQTSYELPQASSTGEVTQQLFWAYQKSKAAWRQWMGKPTRAVRRFIRKRAGRSGQNKGKGRGKSSGACLASMSDAEVDVFVGLG